VLLQALFGRRGDRLQLSGEARGRVAATAAFARHGLRALGEAAVKHGLTGYDAAYLALALDRGLPLATLDKPLAAAARAEEVPILGPLAP